MENFENTKDINISINILKQQLENYGIDISQWGTGQTKTIEHLLKEIEEGETILVIGKEGKLLRKVIAGGADIYYVDSNKKRYRLKEEKQVFKDGRERQRDYLDQSVSEKMKPSENPKEAMIRGIKEELGIEGEIVLTKTDAEEQILVSPSYPGLQSQYVRHKFEAILNDAQFKPEGYIEEQADKTTYFIWEEIK